MRFHKSSLREARWVSTGFRRSFHQLTRWVSAGNDKALVRKRLTILGCCAAGVIVLSYEYPKVAMAAIPTAVLLLCAWFGRWPHEEMTMHASDYEAPSETAEKPPAKTDVSRNDDALRRFVEKYPKESAGALAERLSEVVAPRVVTEEDVTEALARQGITLPDASRNAGRLMKKLRVSLSTRDNREIKKVSGAPDAKPENTTALVGETSPKAGPESERVYTEET